MNCYKLHLLFIITEYVPYTAQHNYSSTQRHSHCICSSVECILRSFLLFLLLMPKCQYCCCYLLPIVDGITPGCACQVYLHQLITYSMKVNNWFNSISFCIFIETTHWFWSMCMICSMIMRHVFHDIAKHNNNNKKKKNMNTSEMNKCHDCQ